MACLSASDNYPQIAMFPCLWEHMALLRLMSVTRDCWACHYLKLTSIITVSRLLRKALCLSHKLFLIQNWSWNATKVNAKHFPSAPSTLRTIWALMNTPFFYSVSDFMVKLQAETGNVILDGFQPSVCLINTIVLRSTENRTWAAWYNKENYRKHHFSL